LEPGLPFVLYPQVHESLARCCGLGVPQLLFSAGEWENRLCVVVIFPGVVWGCSVRPGVSFGFMSFMLYGEMVEIRESISVLY